MKTVETVCPNCQKELTTKLFAVESSSTHTVRCRFCGFDFSIDAGGAVVEKGAPRHQEPVRKKVIGIQHGKRRLELDIPEGTREYELLERMEKTLQRKLSKGRPRDNGREMESGSPPPDDREKEIEGRKGSDRKGPERVPDHPEYEPLDRAGEHGIPGGPYEPYPGDGPIPPEHAYPYGPYPVFPGGFPLKRKMPLKEKFFYGLSVLFIFLFFSSAFVFFAFPSNSVSSGETADIAGTVTNETGAAVAGAVVTIEGTNLSGTTDSNGTFVLEDVETGKQTIVVTAEGYRNFSFTTYLLAQDWNFEYDGTEEFEFRLSRDRDVAEDKTDHIKGQANLLTTASVLYLVLVLAGMLFVYRKDNFVRTVAIFGAGVLLAFFLMVVFFEVSISLFAILYFPVGIIVTLGLKGEFEFYRHFGRTGFGPGPGYVGKVPPDRYPGDGEIRHEDTRAGEKRSGEAPRRIKYSELYPPGKRGPEDTGKDHTRDPANEVSGNDLPGKEGPGNDDPEVPGDRSGDRKKT